MIAFKLNKNGLVYYNQKDYNEALKFFNQAIKLNSSNVDALLNRSLCAYHLGQFESALGSLEKAIELDPDLLKAHIYIGRSLYKLKKINKAFEHYDRLLEYNSESFALIYFYKALLLKSEKKYNEAIIYFGKSISKNIYVCEAYLNKSICRLELKDIENSLADYKKAIDEPNLKVLLKYLNDIKKLEDLKNLNTNLEVKFSYLIFFILKISNLFLFFF